MPSSTCPYCSPGCAVLDGEIGELAFGFAFCKPWVFSASIAETTEVLESLLASKLQQCPTKCCGQSSSCLLQSIFPHYGTVGSNSLDGSSKDDRPLKEPILMGVGCGPAPFVSLVPLWQNIDSGPSKSAITLLLSLAAMSFGDNAEVVICTPFIHAVATQ
jgi:hypothetical protein